MKNLIYILLTLLLFSSCKAFKTSVKEVTTTSESNKTVVEKFNEFVKEELSKSIYDEFTLAIPNSNTNNKNIDSIVDARVNEVLAKINFNKRSGSNSFRLDYDRLKRELKGIIEVGETKDKTKITDTEKEEISTDSKSETSFTEKTGIPMTWIVMGVTLLFKSEIFWVIKKAVKLIKSV